MKKTERNMWRRKIIGQQGRNERKKYLYGIIWTVEKKKNGKRKGQKYLGNRNIWSEEDKKRKRRRRNVVARRSQATLPPDVRILEQFWTERIYYC